MRPGQVPLMPTIAPPLGLGLGPGHLGLPQPHVLGHPFPQPDLASVRPQSVPSSPSPGRHPTPASLLPPSPHISGASPPTNSKSTFAAALRDLAKNAGDPNDPHQRRVTTPAPPVIAVSSAGNTVTSSLLDVRKGFGRTTPAETRSTPTPFSSGDVVRSASSTPTLSSESVPAGSPMPGPGAGFQPYRSHLDMPGRLGAGPPGVMPGPGYHPAMFSGS